MGARIFLLGLVFGFLLSRAGATDYDRIANMFLLRDLHLVGVIGLAIGVAGLGFRVLRRLGLRAADGQPLQVTKKPRQPGNLWGGFIFGAGWALTGTCPGTALAMLGEGKLTALFTTGGILLGAALYRRSGRRVDAASAARTAPNPAR